ncbi:dihydrodipicolinate synthase family protein [Agromyces sp. Leaf222]|uniref:dihydrodipicolinate synthase family protein n=1 Tax=Agromyces sp. Leaf222 TaxID=1735688 RepID=UPI0009E8F3A2
MTTLTLLDADGARRAVDLAEAPTFAKPRHPLTSRVAYAAAHVVPKAHADNTPGQPAEIDWDATLAFRHHVWSWGLGVADAMDTAQRNMGLDAAATRELISRSAAEAASVGGRLVVGVNTDHVDDEQISLDQVIDAYKEQLHHTEDAGAGVVLMASRHLARAAQTADDYRRVYREVLAAAGGPVVLHWLGTAFDPSLAGYFGSDDTDAAAETLLQIIGYNGDKVQGVKMSLLDADAEIAVRRRLPESARMFTGDDFHYVGLIEGDEQGHSDALLGAFSCLAPNASAAIQALDRGDVAGYREILAPTEPLSQQVFAAPTYYYKTGVAFLSWLNGHQAAFQMVGGLHAARSLPHLSRIVELANASGALERPELAAARWHSLLTLNGVDVTTVTATDAAGEADVAGDAASAGQAGPASAATAAAPVGHAAHAAPAEAAEDSASADAVDAASVDEEVHA